jgi:LacI family transcriptional regulator
MLEAELILVKKPMHDQEVPVRQAKRDPRHVTLRDVARQCGMSLTTVSRALNHPEFHKEETVERILSVALELGYNPAYHDSARRLSLRRHGIELLNHQIALVFPQDFAYSNYFRLLFAGIWDVLTPAGFGLVLLKSSSFVSSQLPVSFARGEIDGVIMHVTPSDWYAAITKLREESNFGPRPVMSLLSNSIPGCSSVEVDARCHGYLAVKHLLGLGHRAIMYQIKHIDMQPLWHISERVAGYQQAMQEHGLDPAIHLIPVDIGAAYWEIANEPKQHHLLSALPAVPRSDDHPLLVQLRRHPEVTAVLAHNDASAILIRHVLDFIGIRVPEDMSIIGVDDTDPMLDAEGRNMLTTVRLPLEEAGRLAARELIRQLTDKDESQQESRHFLPTELIVRGSTAPSRR